MGQVDKRRYPPRGPVPSNPNLLDNWYFVNPINQRGQTSYQGLVYGIDRWAGRNAATAVTIKDGYIEISQTINNYQAGINYSFAEVKELAGKTVTFSAIMRSDGVNAPSLRVRNSVSATNTINVTGDKRENWQLLTLTVQMQDDCAWNNNYGDSAYFGFFFSSTSDISISPHIDVLAAKLELGDHQTLAYLDEQGQWQLNDPPPDKALELAKCQRYQVVPAPTGYYRCLSVLAKPDYIQFTVDIPSTLRETPTLVNVNRLIVADISNSPLSGFTFVVNGVGPGWVGVTAHKTAHGLTAAQLLISWGDGPLIFDANL